MCLTFNTRISRDHHLETSLVSRVTKALKIASSSKKNSKSVIMTNFQFSKSLKGSTIITHFLIVKLYQSVNEYITLHNVCTTYQLCFNFYGICYSLSLTEAYHRHAAARFELNCTVMKILLLSIILYWNLMGNEYLCQKQMPWNGYFSHGQL